MKKFKDSKLIPFILVFVFAYVAARTWDRESGATSSAFQSITNPAANSSSVSKKPLPLSFLEKSNPADTVNLEKLFARAYTSNTQTEIANRLIVLKSLAEKSGTDSAGLYKKILSNNQEHWLVKRQAFKNLAPALSEKELNQYYSTLDNRVIRLAHKTEAEILSEVLNEKVGSN